jgi:RNA-directed DNA polymerase
VHNIKANKGSETPGSDGETMRVNILEEKYQEVMARVKDALKDYHPAPVRRVYIPKPGKTEERPLGIPAAVDKVVQECVRIVIEPILEAQFFAHSYGFRPMRDAHMALVRVTDIVHKTGYHWVVEGDISKFFDNVNHTKLVKKLWHMGIRDRRVLMVIKAMLKAGIMDELEENPLGTPQGGIISPILANAYLDTLDQWVTREWENKKTKTEYSQHGHMLVGLRKRSNLKPVYLVRYADDWTLVTSYKSNAEKWKRRIAKYLDVKLKLTLSEEKTVITDIRKKPIHFLGFTYKVIKGRKSRTGYITKTSPDPQRLKAKVAEILRNTKRLKRIMPGTKNDGKERLIAGVNLVNSQIRGVIQYYQAATRASP